METTGTRHHFQAIQWAGIDGLVKLRDTLLRNEMVLWCRCQLLGLFGLSIDDIVRVHRDLVANNPDLQLANYKVSALLKHLPAEPDKLVPIEKLNFHDVFVVVHGKPTAELLDDPNFIDLMRVFHTLAKVARCSVDEVIQGLETPAFKVAGAPRAVIEKGFENLRKKGRIARQVYSGAPLFAKAMLIRNLTERSAPDSAAYSEPYPMMLEYLDNLDLKSGDEPVADGVVGFNSRQDLLDRFENPDAIREQISVVSRQRRRRNRIASYRAVTLLVAGFALVAYAANANSQLGLVQFPELSKVDEALLAADWSTLSDADRMQRLKIGNERLMVTATNAQAASDSVLGIVGGFSNRLNAILALAASFIVAAATLFLRLMRDDKEMSNQIVALTERLNRYAD